MSPKETNNGPEKKCIVCGNGTFNRYIKKNDWTVYICKHCGQGVTTPFPSQEQLEKFYNERYFSTHFTEPEPDSSVFKKVIRNQAHRVRYIRKSKKSGLLLDIGCGKGHFLYAAQKYYTCEGLDVSAANKSYIEEKLGMPLNTNGIENAEYPDNHFDIITLWHNLEHLNDPSACIKKCLTWLKEDGVLIIEVPNYLGLDALTAGIEWPGWDMPFHLHFFTIDSLAQYVHKFKLRSSLTKTYLSEYVKSEMNKHMLTKPFSRMIAKLFTGHSVLITCKKA